ncbi:hypothetical protein [Oerskovia gallyi]|uniref:Uncharacterized protein n=1 Tax=Oerskovia gallyi TaxID=2762226 RepID=A0ABR8V1K0_9CELL|nr:hypothetical protein [Oerskovia gallyi]MBD7998654.1 hypothetical protein [Oerskovia gallyi]
MSPPFPRNQKLAEKVMRRLNRTLRGREHDGLKVVALLHYGAVDIDPRHLVVWILLGGKPDDQIPAWLRVSPLLIESLRPTTIDYTWLLALRSEVQGAFRAARWADLDNIAVMVDSEHRVATSGFDYFRG